jgi:hypothetical protein
VAIMTAELKQAGFAVETHSVEVSKRFRSS